MKIRYRRVSQCGKEHSFNAITRAGAECANYPFCPIEPNVGVVAVPDARLGKIAEIEHPENYTNYDRIR